MRERLQKSEERADGFHALVDMHSNSPSDEMKALKRINSGSHAEAAELTAKAKSKPEKIQQELQK